MRFGHLELPVADARRSLVFYREKLGFELVADQGPFLWVQRGGLEILLRPGASGGEHAIVFYTDDPAAEAAAVAKRGVAVEKKGNCYRLKDPDGHEIQIVNPEDDHSG